MSWVVEMGEARDAGLLEEVFHSIIDGLSVGILVAVDRNSVIYTNRMIHVIASRKDGVKCSNNRFLVEDVTTDNKFRDLIQTALQNSIAAPGGLYIPRLGGGRPYPTFVCRLGLSSGRACAIGLIVDPDLGYERAAEQLGLLFDFTRAERRVAVGLLAGRTLHEIAAEHGVTVNTIRTQLKQLFHKTDTKRQIDLLRVLSAFTFVVTPEMRQRNAAEDD